MEYSNRNQWQGDGNLTRDPRMETTKGGTMVAKFSIASNDIYKEQKTTSFIDCDAFGKMAEIVGGFVKGDRVYVIGKLKQQSWEKDGEKHSKMSIMVSQVFKYPAFSRGHAEEEIPFV